MPRPVSEATARNRAECHQRVARHRARRKALIQAAAGGSPDGNLRAGEVVAHAARLTSREALTVARGAFDDKLGSNAEKLAEALIGRALDGDTACLLTAARSVIPPARFDSHKITLPIDRLDSAEDIDHARKQVALATFRGELGLEDADALAKLLDSLGEAVLRGEKQKLLSDMRSAIAGGGTAHVAVLTQRAEVLLSGLKGDGGGSTALIEGTAETDDATGWEELL